MISIAGLFDKLVDFEDVEAGVQNISSIDYETIKYIAKRDENKYMFAEGKSLFEIDLSKRKVEGGKAAYEKIYKTKYIDSFVKSSKNEIYTVYNDNKKLYIEKNDFNKVTEFMQIEGITANSVDLYLKQVEENSRGEKIALWNKLFSNGTNVEFAWIQDAGHIFVRVWERGCGETKACGTGACAVAAAAMRMRKCAMSVVVVLPGGELRVTYGTRSRHLYLTGPAEEIFSGEVKIG